MSKVDEELSRRFHGAERPVETDGLFEGLARRHAHRRTLQRVQAGALAVAVLAATAGSFVALRAAFDGNGRGSAGGPLPGNGEIVFVRDGEDGRLHLYAAQPDGSGLRQLTEGDTNDSDTAVSPDGRTVAFARGIGFDRAVIATVPIEGGPITWQTAEHYDVTDPAWSPDGSQIAFIGHTADATADLFVADVGSDTVRRISLDAEEPAHPTWSPDGTRIAVAAYPDTRGPSPAADLALVRADGGGDLEWLVTSTADEQAPAWSPDGSRIAYLKPGPEGHEVWTISADGGSETVTATAVEASLMLDLDWAPDGSALLVSDGDWIYRVDATPEGDPRSNFVQLMRGFSPSWQPVPAGSEPSVSPEPSASPSPEPEGRDVGIGFNLCHADRLGGIDFLGDGRNGQAWVGVPAKDDGTCPANARPAAYVVAADADGDGEAETWSELPWDCYVDCVPYDATDLDGNGTEELIVASYFSIVDYHVMTYTDGGGASPRIAPVLVAEPGHEPADVRGGQPLRIDAGGDAGYGSQIECEGYPEAPVLVWSWSHQVVDSDEPTEVHITKIQLGSDGRFHVVDTNDYSVPAGQPTGIERSTAPACGVDWHPSA